jgi:hypothetical protein
MDDKTIKSILDRLQKLEHEVSIIRRGPASASDEKVIQNSLPATAASFEGVTGGIRFLLSKDFFKGSKSLSDIKAEMERHDYHSSLQAVQMGLNRLSKPSGPLITFKENNKKLYAKRK